MNQSELKACEACKSSKRKCTKQLPRCQRCELRGLNCVYESRPCLIVYQADSEGGGFSRLDRARYDQEESFEYLQCGEPSTTETITVDPPLELQLLSSKNPTSPSVDDLRAAWFMTADSWKRVPFQLFHPAPVSIALIHKYVEKTKDWLREWISNGSNPFIHKELYSKSTPGCIQDAFLSLSTYSSMTPKTRGMVLRFIEEKTDRLVASQASGEFANDTLGHIGRVQALLVYSVIRLFDGDIRQRHLAEQYLPVLQDWTQQMLEHTSQAASDGTLLLCNALTNYTPQLTSDFPIPYPISPEQLLWHAWILSESVRRTWYISMFVLSGYELLKTGTGPCHGSMKLTTRRGVWDATTASAWTKLCAERSIGFAHRNDTEKFMTERRMDEVDEFTLALMEVDFGPEGMERWQLANEC